MGHSMERPGPAPCQRQYQGALHLASAANLEARRFGWHVRMHWQVTKTKPDARHATPKPSEATETAKPTSIEIEEMNPAHLT